MTDPKFLQLLKSHGFHIGDGVDDCAGFDEEAEILSASEILKEVKKDIKNAKPETKS